MSWAGAMMDAAGSSGSGAGATASNNTWINDAYNAGQNLKTDATPNLLKNVQGSDMYKAIQRDAANLNSLKADLPQQQAASVMSEPLQYQQPQMQLQQFARQQRPAITGYNL